MANIQILNDGEIDIATGRSRREKNWKNKTVLWSKLVQKLSTTTRTAETYKTYLTSDRGRQDEIKDIGGFVGGYLSGGRRKADTVLHRQLVTLDIDNGSRAIWTDFLTLYGTAAVIYSTHKHSNKKPRYRLVIPLNREVKADEYTAIGRRIAGDLGIDYFDNTGFEPSRLMYWPSTSSDGDYFFEYIDDKWLDADEVLNSYTDWRDASEWPVSEQYEIALQRDIKKQGDPLEKPGIVGAFCRTYDIHAAIEKFLPEIYEACEQESRYTYKEGSTAAGLVTYDDLFAYSHHGTDPTSGKLCNAFDLVRIHLFGLEDEDAKEDTPINRMPSYKTMADFATQDESVRKLVGKERILEARAEFELADDVDDITGDEEWLGKLEVDQKGRYYSTVDNIVLILENDPAMKGAIALNQFDKREVALRHLPWRKVTPSSKYLIDKDDAGIRYYLEKSYGISSAAKVKDGIDMVLLNHSFHPVKDYLESVQWDGIERIDTLLIDYMGAEDTEYTRHVIRKALVAAVARIYQPGVKFDNVLTLVGEEGIGKSELWARLGMGWFSDSLTTIKGKEAYEQVQGVWIIEMAELSATKRADSEAIKHFISKRVDRFRMAYGKRSEDCPRTCIFVASTNIKDFLKGANGDRRFWPVMTEQVEKEKDVFKHLTQEEVNNIWAEAVKLYRAGEKVYLDKRIELQARKIQEFHAETDERFGLIQKFLDTFLPANWDSMNIYEKQGFIHSDDELKPRGTTIRDRVCAAEIWCELLRGKSTDMTSYNTRFIHDIMRKMEGWEEYKSRTVFKGYGNQKGYFRVKNHPHNTTVRRKLLQLNDENDEN